MDKSPSLGDCHADLDASELKRDAEEVERK